jgi:hypothetical protein
MRRNATLPEMERPLPVRLTDSEMADRAQEIAAKISLVKVLRKKKRDDARNTQVLIDNELDQVELLAEAITDARELRKQGELFVDQETATRALAQVGQAVCTCPPGGVLVDCAVHGDDAPTNLEHPEDAADLADEEDEHGEAEGDDDGDDDEDDEDDEKELARIAQANDAAGAALAARRGPRGPLRRAAGRRGGGKR